MAESLRSEIFQGSWKEWIPSEREISELLHVSRNTCRSALHILYRESLVEPVRGRGIRVNQPAVYRSRPTVETSRSLGVIIPESLGRLRPGISLLIEELQTELFDLGVRLQLHSSPGCYRQQPDHALERLVERNPHSCWMLLLAHQPLQRWFMDRGLPCLVSGSVYSDIKLPSVDYDFRAVGRHAAGKLISLGHRRIVFFNRRLLAAGDLETELGVLEGARASSEKDVDVRVVYHEDNLDSVVTLIKKTFSVPTPPTAVIVANAYCCLSVLTALTRLGLRVPEDVSLISRDDDPYLAYLEPEPARYNADGAALARKAMLLIRTLLEGGDAKMEPIRLVPRFTAGGSLRKI